ncbi:hypothetical protein HHK36_006582 [Tetracentron sinense]|uniref:Uncharacterized protein n=1 Tax=Tetracentron sinense TaxID=13715 RepID=A0A835DPA3_TETSI|nr:hypothetical protein HHK36_006582 [Tetracentron sinense]
MGFLRNLAVLLPLLWILWSLSLRAQSPRASNNPARILDSLLQDYAYRALVHPNTGIPYAGNVPSNLTGIKVSAMRLRSSSLTTRGLQSYKEFIMISLGILVEPNVERLVLVNGVVPDHSQEWVGGSGTRLWKSCRLTTILLVDEKVAWEGNQSIPMLCRALLIV